MKLKLDGEGASVIITPENPDDEFCIQQFVAACASRKVNVTTNALSLGDVSVTLPVLQTELDRATRGIEAALDDIEYAAHDVRSHLPVTS